MIAEAESSILGHETLGAGTVDGLRAKWLTMKMPLTRNVRIALAAATMTIPGVCLAASPQSIVDELLAADRGFSAASANTDLISGLTAMFADDVVIPNPPGQFAEGKAAVVAMLRANADNAQSRTEWTPVRGGVSADGQQGFTAGFMTLTRPDGATLALKYLAYWVKHPEGWRVAAYKRARAGDGSASHAMIAPSLPSQLVAPSTDAAVIARYRESLDGAEQAFSNEAQKIGLGPAFAIPKALKMAGLKLSDIDVIELNEAFAAQSLAVIKQGGLDPALINPNGGAIALGHPLGCTGAKLTTTIARELQRRKARYGMVTMCVGGGMGAAGIFENLR